MADEHLPFDQLVTNGQQRLVFSPWRHLKKSFMRQWLCRRMLAPRLTERLIASLAEDVSPEIASAQLAEVRRRIAQVESGEATLIPGDEALARAKSACGTSHSANGREMQKPGATPQVENPKNASEL